MYYVKTNKSIKSKIKLLIQKYSAASTIGFALLFIFVSTIYFVSKRIYTASAAATPVKCFAFTPDSPSVGQATITNYYDNEDNDSNKPACTKEVEVPGEIDGYIVKKIDEYAFMGKRLRKVKISENITDIEYNAFSQNIISDIQLPATLKNIGAYAFDKNQIYSLNFPNNVNFISSRAFANNFLTSLVVPSSVTQIANSSFENNNITDVIINGSLSLGNPDIFKNNPITSLTYNGNTYTSNDPISDSCFEFNNSSGAITKFLKADIDTIINHGQACLNTNIDIPSSIGGVVVEQLNHNSFSKLNIDNVTIPNSVVSISQSAFAFNRIKNIVIPASVEYIGDDAFYENKITTVEIIGNNIISSSGREFWDNPIETFIYNGTVHTKNDPIGDDCYKISGNSIIEFQKAYIPVVRDKGQACLNPDIIIPESINGITVTSISGYFSFRSGYLKSVSFPDTIVSIGDQAFIDNDIETISFGSNLYEIGIAAFAGNKLTELNIPSSVNLIKSMAFLGNHIENVFIENQNIILEDYVFALQSVHGGASYDDYSASRQSIGVGEQLLESIVLVKIYSINANFSNITDAIFHESDFGSTDIDGDGSTLGIMGGQIINPAFAVLSYTDEEGNEIMGSSMHTGSGLMTYLAKENTSSDLSVYYRPGDSFTPPNAPSISGYQLVAALSASNLNVGSNEFVYTYKVLGTNTGGNNNSGNNGNGNNPGNGNGSNTSGNNGNPSNQGSNGAGSNQENNNQNQPTNGKGLNNTGKNSLLLSLMSLAFIAMVIKFRSRNLPKRYSLSK